MELTEPPRKTRKMNEKTEKEKNHTAPCRDTRFWMRRLWFLWLVALLLASGGTALPATFEVDLGSDSAYFDPDHLTIQTGDTVQWVWGNSGYPGRVVSGRNGMPNGIFDSGTHPAPYTFSYTFANVGTFDYYNGVRPDATGVIRVVAATATGLVGNVSTRLPVGTGDNALIEGFIVQGPGGSTKKIIVRAIGPSLAPFGITDALANPTLEIHDSSANNATVATNDDWKNTQVGGLISGDQSAEIAASGVAPSNDLESAIIANLAPGSYTAVVRGAANGTGTGVVDAYDLSAASPAKLANIATRGLVQPGDKLMIAGFIIQNGPVRAVVRAIGPSLTAFGINNALQDTTLQLRDANGVIVVENDNWKVRSSDGSSQQAEVEATGLQPSNDLEAAVVVTLPPGQYSAQVRGKPEATGTGVVQAYFLP